MARICSLLVVSFLLLAPTSASAALFGEAPIGAFEGSQECLQATGAPGELTYGEGDGSPLLLLKATAEGITLDRDSGLKGCGHVAARPNGAGIVAGEQFEQDGIQALLREPGGTWGAKVRVTDPSYAEIVNLSVAVSDRGDAVIAWYEFSSAEPQPSVRAAYRPAGGAFGPPQTLAASDGPLTLQTAVAANGEAVVLWSTREGEWVPFRQPVRVAISSPAGTFSAPATVGESNWRSVPALAMAQDGRALVALPDAERIRVAERAPGGAFGAPVTIAAARDRVGSYAHAVLGAGGAAAVSWETTYGRGVHVTTRPPGGSFRPAVTLDGDAPFKNVLRLFTSEAFDATAGGTYAYTTPESGLTLSDDGTALVALTHAGAAELASVTLGTGAVVRHALPRLLLTPAVTVPLVLAGGASAIAYADYGDALHLGADGLTAPGAPLPRVTVDTHQRKLVRNGLRFLPVECDGPCDVEARVGDGFDRVRLTKAGRARFQLFTDAKRPRVRLTYSAPAGPETATKIVSLRVRTVDTLGALPRPLDVKAVRRGGKIEVSWRTAKPLAGDQTGIVYGTRTRSVKQDPLDVAPVYLEADKRRFSGTLTHDVREQRWVTLTVNHFEKTVKVH